ncbi:hypothetical protein [Allokutzneria albata]|uniref:Necrosis inducing protein (NPP1) n=1 Tax=Allokutzneria albata TaxID=211114 RepID=A0A1G9WHL0_ALLAB|nr:hypothetical protein [Allokutzneria albata]SDM83656.1 hypothetical protein SAMN04489726_3603 [Allokutzneria albata]
MVVVLAVVAALVASFVASPAPPASAAVSDAELAYHWAPVHYQDTDSSNASADYLSPIDFDGNWTGRDNWENQARQQQNLRGAAYYSVTENAHFHYLLYAFFHPRDWSDWNPLEEHENDLEGVLVVVQKGGQWGTLRAMVTVPHRDFYSYTPAGSPFTSGRENIDGTIVTTTHDGVARPSTFQEAKGHGLYRWDGRNFPGGDGVVYYPARGTGEVPSGGNDRRVGYQLIDVFAAGGLWAHRDDPATFRSWGTFSGDNGRDNAANAPWGWDDHDDEPGRGELATDPARVIRDYFADADDQSSAYVRNPYR